MAIQSLSDSKRKYAPGPEHYRRHRRQLLENGVRRQHAKSTQNNIQGIKKKWIRHCEFLGENRLTYLVEAKKEDVMIFLKWLLDNSNIKKFSSLHENWRLWCQLYRKAIGRSLHVKCYEAINDYMRGTLVPQYKLDLTTEEKPVMNVDDLYIVLKYHWVQSTTPYPDGRQIIQLAFLMLVSAYTASRPGALVYVDRNERTNVSHFYGQSNSDDVVEVQQIDWDSLTEDLKTLCWGQITLVLLPNPGGLRDYLAMEVDLRHTKGHQNNPKRKIFLMSEVKEPVFDIILLILALAFIDDAFEPEYIQSVEDLFMTRVLEPRRSLILKFKKEKLNVPVCRQPISTISEMGTDDMKPLLYHTYLSYLRVLSLCVGKPKAMKPYEFRRCAAEAIDGVVSPALLQQVMGHMYASTIQKYMNPRVQTHVQAAVLGIPSEDAMMSALSHQSRYIDPRAPAHWNDLSPKERGSISKHPDIIRLEEIRDQLSIDVRELYGTMKRAEGTELGNLKRKADDDLRCAKAKLKKMTFNAARDHFFDTIDTKEINKQLDPSYVADGADVYRAAQAVVHTLEERRHVAELMAAQTNNFSEEQALQHRMSLLKALINLGRAKNIPSERQATNEKGADEQGFDTSTLEALQPVQEDYRSSPEPRSGPVVLTNKHCLFCVFSPRHQCCFATPRKAREHFEKHLRALGRNVPIKCPDEFCQLVLQGENKLKLHAQMVHKVLYFTVEQRIRAGF
ncbi:hypothetical protein BJY01DRAFT_212753 [Aspergillus pseudoustus]|uniref:C2H2-type domain-containing protein n=1 Tax=Aspergillus pseudoustus TaxID=1810923 RepID=A0ABR4K7R4_9EURO